TWCPSQTSKDKPGSHTVSISNIKRYAWQSHGVHLKHQKIGFLFLYFIPIGHPAGRSFPIFCTTVSLLLVIEDCIKTYLMESHLCLLDGVPSLPA
ncbi:hypothetical protein Bpfe_016134, partial [Biomphalaria pfeifferi]